MPQLATPTPLVPATLADMLTLHVTLHGDGAAAPELGLAVTKPEWLGLVSHFTRMPADERARVGHSIQAALAHSPFPAHGGALSRAEQAACDTFVSDCVLLAALAEATTPRVLNGTAIATYRLNRGNQVKARLH
jgi:hypothetical protein